MTNQKLVDRGPVAGVLQTAAREALHASVGWHHLLMERGQDAKVALPTEGEMLAVVSAKALRALHGHVPNASSQEIATMVWHLMDLVEEVHLGWLDRATGHELFPPVGDAVWGYGLTPWLKEAADRCLHVMVEELARSGLVLAEGIDAAAREAA